MKCKMSMYIAQGNCQQWRSTHDDGSAHDGSARDGSAHDCSSHDRSAHDRSAHTALLTRLCSHGSAHNHTALLNTALLNTALLNAALLTIPMRDADERDADEREVGERDDDERVRGAGEHDAGERKADEHKAARLPTTAQLVSGVCVWAMRCRTNSCACVLLAYLVPGACTLDTVEVLVASPWEDQGYCRAYDKPKRRQSCRGMRAAWQIQLGRRACFAG